MTDRAFSDEQVDMQFDAWLQDPLGAELLSVTIALGPSPERARQILRCAFIAGNTGGMQLAQAVFTERAATVRARRS